MAKQKTNLSKRSDQRPPDAELETEFNWWWRRTFLLAREPDAAIKLWQVVKGALGIDQPKPVDHEPTQKSNAAGAAFALLHSKHERSAFLYELANRVTGKYEFGKSWIQLSQQQRDKLALRWPMKSALIARFSYRCEDLETPAEEGWSEPIVSSWNLGHNDDTLAKHFIDGIRAARERLGVPSPKQHQERGRLKPLSWRCIELMDIAKIAILNDSERSQVSKAKKLYHESVTKK